MRIQNVRDFPQTKGDSEITPPFLSNEHGDPQFFFQVFAKNSLIKNIIFYLKKKKSLKVEHFFFFFFPLFNLLCNYLILLCKSYTFLSLGDTLQLGLRPVRLSGHVILLL